jgi:3-hydroxy-9,10-secoandrosta-1,3,5(10)-triene-9,17-dione monooxygenase
MEDLAVSEAGSAAASPSAATLTARARALTPLLAAGIADADRNRDLSPDTVAALQEAGLFRLFRPIRWGGYESDPETFFDVQNLLAETCASAAWVQGVLGVQALIVALFDPRAQAEVWGAAEDALVCSAFQPTGTVEACDGGYRLRGRWRYSSGSSHCRWALLGGLVASAEPAGPPAMRLFLVPRSDWQIVDSWHTFGLRGTGSNDLVVADAFVPAYRSLQPDGGILNVPRAVRPGPALYRLPWLFLFSSAVSNFAVGSARGAVKAFLAVAGRRVAGITGKVAREDPDVHVAAARLLAEADMVELTNRRNAARLMEHVAADTTIPLAEALMIRAQTTSGLRRIAALVDDLMLLSGAGSSSLEAPLTRIWLDLGAARVHPGNDPLPAGAMLGRELMAAAGG